MKRFSLDFAQRGNRREGVPRDAPPEAQKVMRGFLRVLERLAQANAGGAPVAGHFMREKP